MATGKFVDYYSCLEGNEGQQADAEQAYVQAELKGTETWVYIPPEGWPDVMLSSICKDAGQEFRTPVVRLKRALYGHPDSGGFWEEHCNKCLAQAGFQPIRAWPSCVTMNS